MTARSRRNYRSNFSPFRIIAYLLIGGITHALTKSAVPYVTNDTTADVYNNVTTKFIKTKSRNSEYCVDGLILGAWQTSGEINVGDRVLRGFVYFGILAYMFLGVAIVCEHFMASIEVITSSRKQVVVSRKDGVKETINVPIWNETVANLTLMAFGSSAPEILLSVVELFVRNFEAGELGPGTIVGSAAYNLFVIPAICISAVPHNEVRRIKHLQVFMVTAAWSIFAYIWLYMIVAIISPARIEIWEGVLTLCFFPMTVLHAYLAEREYLCYRKPKSKKRKEQQFRRMNSLENPTKWNIVRESARYSFGGEQSRLSYVAMLAELREKYPQDDIEVLKIMAQENYINRGYKSRAFYRIQASRRMTGRGNIARKTIYQALDHMNQVKTELTAVDVSKTTTRDQEFPVHVYFEPSFYKVMEDCGEFNLRVVRYGDVSSNTKVEYLTEGGTAKPGVDYVPKKGLLTFPPGVEDRFITIEIIDDDIFEKDQYFYVRLTNPSDPAVLSEPYVATVLVLDDDHSGLFTFKEKQYEMTESVNKFELIVERHGGARGKVLVPFWTENGSAVAGKEYEPQRGELIFENNDTEKSILLTIIEEGKYTKDEIFYVNLGNPVLAPDDKISELIKSVESKEESELTQEERTMLMGRPKIGNIGRTTLRITESKNFQNTVDRLIKKANAPILLGTSSWKEQFAEAFTVSAAADDDLDSDDEGENMPSRCDYAMHFITLLWKILFAFIPPTKLYNGYFAFVVSLLIIGILTAVIVDSASLFGCFIGMSDTLTAITLVSIGTSIPDTFASKIAAVQDDCADNSIGNVTGSNAVNVFAGIGVAWSVGAIYHATKGRKFIVIPGSLAFTITTYVACAMIAISTLLWRRNPSVGGELGGPIKYQIIHSSLFLFLYISYIILNALEAYGIISGF